MSYGVWDQNQVPALKQIIADFEKTNKNIKVKVQVTPYDQYFTKLQAAATGGAAPDVFWMNGPNFQLYASNGVLAPISDQIKKDGLDTSVYPKSLVDLYSLDGKQFGLPKDFDTIGLWYNKTLFDDAGVKYPDATWTWADLQNAAAKLTNKSKGIYGIPASLEGQQNFYNTILQAGGYIISPDGKSSGYDDPATIKGLRFWTDLIESGSSPSLKQMTDTLPLQWFESGKAAMFYGGSWNVVGVQEERVHRGQGRRGTLAEGREAGVVIHGLANVISAKTKHADAGVAVREVPGLQRPRPTSRPRPAPSSPPTTGPSSAWVAASPEYDLKVFLDATAYSTPYPVSQNTAAWNTDETKYLTQAWDGKEDVATAADQLAKAMNADLAKEQK